jgi:hypothetical protein
MSAPPRSSHRSSYMEVPLGETGATSPRPGSGSSRPSSGRPSSGTVASYRAETVPGTQTAKPRAAKFTEAWYASESLINRTQQRARASNLTTAAHRQRAYEALNQSYDTPDSDSENDHVISDSRTKGAEKTHNNENDTNDLGGGATPHPNPLRSNPAARRPKTPFNPLRNSVLSNVSLNDRRVSGSQDITDEKAGSSAAWKASDRNSSIQAETTFYSKPYGDLKPGTPPIIIGGGRQVSSGNDYDLGGASGAQFGRRHVSGKIAEEGRAGQGRYSRYDPLDE